MKIVIAPDSFKECMTALAVANAIEAGFKKVYPSAEYVKIPMADGGEGTLQSLIDATQGEMRQVVVTSPIGEKITASLGLSGDKKTAIIEMASASGLHLVPYDKRNPLYTTSFGTGELILAALSMGVEKIILGIGGSATNDAGVGMLQALGYQFLDHHHRPIAFGGANLANIATINLTNVDPRLHQVVFEVACDVDNPLCGEYGASAVFGPQKGATPEMIKQLDQSLSHFAKVVDSELGIDIYHRAGAGAAGGMGGGVLLFPNVELKKGVEIVINATQLANYIACADLVITGEGRMDAQSIHGKTPIGVAKVAKSLHKPVIAIVGSLRHDYEVVYENGIDAVFPIISEINDLETTLKHGENNIISCAQNVARLLKLTQL